MEGFTRQVHALEQAAVMLRAIARGESYSTGEYYTNLLKIEACAGIDKLERVMSYLNGQHPAWTQEYQDTVNVLIEANNALFARFQNL